MVSEMHGLPNWQTAQALATDEPFPGLAALPFSSGGVEDDTICWIRVTSPDGFARAWPVQVLYLSGLEAIDRHIAGTAAQQDLRLLDEKGEEILFGAELNVWGFCENLALRVSDFRNARQRKRGVWELHDGRKVTFISPATYPYSLSTNNARPSDPAVSLTLDVYMPDVVGHYDRAEDVPEWQWIADQASFAHLDNRNAAYEFIVHVDEEMHPDDYEAIPETLKPFFARAKREGIARICFHNG
jgi:hypothetical protein